MERMEETKKACKILVGKFEGKMLLRRHEKGE
jgi:hypothetical protein